MDTAIDELVDQAGCARRKACVLVGRAPASHYRSKQPPKVKKASVEKRAQVQSRALSESENKVILDTLHSERFVDQAPASVYAKLLDEGRYIG